TTLVFLKSFPIANNAGHRRGELAHWCCVNSATPSHFTRNRAEIVAKCVAKGTSLPTPEVVGIRVIGHEDKTGSSRRDVERSPRGTPPRWHSWLSFSSAARRGQSSVRSQQPVSRRYSQDLHPPLDWHRRSLINWTWRTWRWRFACRGQPLWRITVS